MINSIIMDNEEHFVITLSKLLKINFPEINIIATAFNIQDGAALIKQHKPELVFLDVEFTNEMGFDLFNHFDKIDFDVIFVSSHQEYALKAIKYAAFDYILKPVDLTELKMAVERYKEKKNVLSVKNDAIQLLLENFQTNHFKKIAFSTSAGIRIVPIDQIIRCDADASYCNIFLSNKEKLTVTKNLKDVEELLPSNLFLRVHKSHLVNTNYIKEFNRKEGGTVVMTDNTEICVSVRKRDIVIDFLKKITH